MKTRETTLRKSLLATCYKLNYFYCKKDHIDLININDRTINYNLKNTFLIYSKVVKLLKNDTLNVFPLCAN